MNRRNYKMSKFCGKCGKPIADNMDLCTECEAKSEEDMTLTLNPIPPKPEVPVEQSAPAPKPPKPEKPIVTEFPIVRIDPKTDAIAKEKSSARNRMLIMAGISLAALICVALIIFGIYKLATRPSKDTSEPKSDTVVVTETVPNEKAPENIPETDNSKNDLPEKDKESKTDSELILNDKEYYPYSILINGIYNYLDPSVTNENDYEIPATILEMLDTLNESEKPATDYLAYDLIELTDNEKYELVVFMKAVSEEERHTKSAPEILCVWTVDNGETELILCKEDAVEYYLCDKVIDDKNIKENAIIMHYTDETNTEKFEIYNNLSDVTEKKCFDCFVKSTEYWCDPNGFAIDENNQSDKYIKKYNTSAINFDNLNPLEEIKALENDTDANTDVNLDGNPNANLDGNKPTQSGKDSIGTDPESLPETDDRDPEPINPNISHV